MAIRGSEERRRLIRGMMDRGRTSWAAYTRTQERQIYDLFAGAADRLQQQLLRYQRDGAFPPARLPAMLGDPRSPHPDSILGQMRQLRPRLAGRIQKAIGKSVDYGMMSAMTAMDAAVRGTTLRAAIGSAFIRPDGSVAKWAASSGSWPTSSWARINGRAMDALVRGGPQGLIFSDRVWRITDATQRQLRSRIMQGVALGEPVQRMAADIKKYLVEPNKLFRRVRDPATGRLRLSRAAAAYHPGPGVYRSSHMNAMRLAQTEMSRGYNEGLWRYIQEKDWIDGAVWHTVHWRPCPECESLEGRFFPKDAMTMIPLHPWCYCEWEPHIEGDPIEKRPPIPDNVLAHLQAAPARVLQPKAAKKIRRVAAKKQEPKEPEPLVAGLDKAATVAQLEAWVRATYPDIQWDLAGCHFEAAKPTIEQFHKLSQQFPEVTKALSYVGTGKTPGIFADAPRFGNEWAHVAYRGRKATLNLNPKWYGDPARFKQSLKDGQIVRDNYTYARGKLARWHPEGCDTIESVLTHEYGHVFDHHLQWAISGAGSKCYTLPWVRSDGIGSVAEMWRKLSRTRGSAELSAYSMKNTAEKLAEAFAAHFHGKGECLKLEVTKRMSFWLTELGSGSKWYTYEESPYRFYATYDEWRATLTPAQAADYDARVAAIRKGLGYK